MLVERDDMIAAYERPEESDGKTRRIPGALKHSAAFSLVLSTSRATEASIHYANGSVNTQRLGRRYVRETGLDALVEAHDLKPFFLVPLYVEVPDCLDASGFAGAVCQEQGRKSKNRKL